eukprot:TRINITY_DN461_c0_g1_i16.p1 TRINITY_DN461_c0_g1~~TRINITY_DN461_c0_g1_i16.p1  ORF type:complete len:120 (+),score=2.79 TRINITY_DN461_c0_g1_i16:27-386(+)
MGRVGGWPRAPRLPFLPPPVHVPILQLFTYDSLYYPLCILYRYKTQTKDGYNTLSSSVNHGDDKESDSLRANAKGPAASVPAASLKSVLEIGGVTAWVWNTLRVKEEEILERCGFDAMM